MKPYEQCRNCGMVRQKPKRWRRAAPGNAISDWCAAQFRWQDQQGELQYIAELRKAGLSEEQIAAVLYIERRICSMCFDSVQFRKI